MKDFLQKHIEICIQESKCTTLLTQQYHRYYSAILDWIESSAMECYCWSDSGHTNTLSGMLSLQWKHLCVAFLHAEESELIDPYTHITPCIDMQSDVNKLGNSKQYVTKKI